MRAADLARHFQVSKRTIYRDVRALAAGGVPVTGIPGVGYALREAFVTPPEVLALDESDAVRLSAFMAATESDPPFDKAHQTALFAEVVPRPPAAAPMYTRLRHAVAARRVTAVATDAEERTIWPLALLRVRGVWFLVAREPALGEDLALPLDTIRAARIGPEVFERPADFKVDAWVPRPRSGHQMVRVWTDPLHAAIERHRAAGQLVADYEHQGGFVLVYHVRTVHELWPRLMGYGGWFQVLHPPGLRRVVARAAQQIAIRHR